MEKELRDAYKALTFVRADLVTTRKAKRDADARAAQQLQQNQELRETLAMRQEDFLARLVRAQRTLADGSPSSALPDNEVEPEREHGDEALPSMEEVAKDQISLLTSVYDLKTQLSAQTAQLVAQEAQFAQDKSEWALLKEALECQVAQLQEAQGDLVREKKFMGEKFEFLSAEVDVVKRERDALQQRLADAERSTASVESVERSAVAAREEEAERSKVQEEMQRLEDQHKDREASLLKRTEILQRTIDEQAAEIVAMRSDLDASRAEEKKLLTENEELQRVHATEQTVWTEEKETLTKCVGEMAEKATQGEDQVKLLRSKLAGKQEETDALVKDHTQLLEKLEQLRDFSTEQLRVHAKQEEERLNVQRSEQEKLQHELTTLLAGFEAATAENAEKLSALQVTNDSLERALADKANDLREAQHSERKTLETLERVQRVVGVYRDGLTSCHEELRAQRQWIVAHQRHVGDEIEQLRQALVARVHAELKRHGDKIAAMERQLALSELERRHVDGKLGLVQDAARTLREALDLETATHQQLQTAHERLQDERIDLERRLQALEQQLLAAEDHRITEEDEACSASESWSCLATNVRALDDFLPQLQLFAGRLQTSFQLCAENARAMDVLSASPSASPTLLADLSSLVRLTQQWRERFESQSLATHVRLVRRSVLATLSQWFEECVESPCCSIPRPPAFAIDSHEVALILDNWTRDVEKQQRVAQWLQKVATATTAGESHEAHVTLELTDMTREVKDAFCVLLVPLLRQNRQVAVRVFTRRVCDVKQSFSPDETSWHMRLHVQWKTPHATTLRRIASTSSVSSIGSTTSSVASSLSLSSSVSASKLQLIQARLQQMQQQQ